MAFLPLPTIPRRITLFSIIFLAFSALAKAERYSVLSYGAKPDGRTDSTKAFAAAWSRACASTNPATISVPQGRFYLGQVRFQGPCKNHAILLRIDGTLVAPSDYKVIGNAKNWLIFENVNGVTVSGGTLDGQGAGLWSCKKSGKGSCPSGATSLEFSNSNNIVITGLASLNSQLFHIVILGCQNAKVQGVKNVTVKTTTFTGTQNGLRIKSWGRPSNGFARDILFQHAVMNNVQNPILIDQNYCPGEKNCPGQDSGVKISDVSYQDIHGSSATEVAVKFDCSKKYRCTGIKLQDVRLTYKNQPAEASCSNTGGVASGLVQPTSCL
ncbi:hypothetical protein OIU84_027852 [Salix udensis]|uniref:Polygalacturonase n=1 Tax=Salix udensis TaxID=889485 RepID=A0AAD6KCV7_9ROSI|nr:hypothetical protein OIU84_027852 [Salix udensis]